MATLGLAPRKPFKDLMGATHELVYPELGMRSICEKVWLQVPMACVENGTKLTRITWHLSGNGIGGSHVCTSSAGH